MNPGRETARRLAPPFLALLAFLVLILLYVTAPSSGRSVLSIWGIKPFVFPFLDLDTVLSALRCRRAGYDVMSSNPCDALGRVFDYSPLWLEASWLPVTTAWIVPGGLALDATFLLSLLMLPPGRSWRETAVITCCVVSTPVVFAMERANNDLLIFVLAAALARCVLRPRFMVRLLGYAFGLLAGLLKYYPLLLLLTSLRERPPRFVAIAIGSALLLLAFVATEFDALTRALRLIPGGSYFGDMFGARILPYGVVSLFELAAPRQWQGELALLCLALAGGVAIGASRRIAADLDRLTDAQRSFLLAGALLTIGCFFTAQNIGYRAIHLLLTAPALAALWSANRSRRVYGWTVGVLLTLLWAQGWRHVLDAALGGTGWPVLGWFVRELCWWWTITLLLGLTLNLLLRSTTVTAFRLQIAR